MLPILMDVAAFTSAISFYKYSLLRKSWRDEQLILFSYFSLYCSSWGIWIDMKSIQNQLCKWTLAFLFFRERCMQGLWYNMMGRDPLLWEYHCRLSSFNHDLSIDFLCFLINLGQTNQWLRFHWILRWLERILSPIW